LLAFRPEADLAEEFQIARDTFANLFGVWGQLAGCIRGAATRTVKAHEFL